MENRKKISAKEFILSGILEMYAVGNASEEEILEVEKMCSLFPEVLVELNEISCALESYGSVYSVAPDITLKPAIFSTIDFIERMKNGEVPANPPVLTNNSAIIDYQEWINRPDMVLTDDFEGIFAKVIAHNKNMSMAIVWLRDGSPMETHYDVLESLLIVEGSCTVSIEEENYYLNAGDVIHIPLFKKHIISVTSSTVCKAILQRIAA